jgi:hypothetical protein
MTGGDLHGVSRGTRLRSSHPSPCHELHRQPPLVLSSSTIYFRQISGLWYAHLFLTAMAEWPDFLPYARHQGGLHAKPGSWTKKDGGWGETGQCSKIRKATAA